MGRISRPGGVPGFVIGLAGLWYNGSRDKRKKWLLGWEWGIVNCFTKAMLTLIILMAGLNVPAVGQWDEISNSVVYMTASCTEGDVVLSIDFTVNGLPPAHIVGWVIEQDLLGPCEPSVLVTDVMPWPAEGANHIDLTITPLNPFFDALYRIYAVDADLNETFIPWTNRTRFAHSECMPGPSTVGRFVGERPEFVPCDFLCWGGLSDMDGYFPSGTEEVADTGQAMALYGSWRSGMHGPYLYMPTMEPSHWECDVIVSTEPVNWGTIKAQYR